MRSMTRILIACLIGASTPLAAAELPSAALGLAPLPPTGMLVLPPIDAAKALAEDRKTALGTTPGPLRYALPAKVAVDVQSAAKAMPGEWLDLPDGTSLWRLEIDAANAIGVDLGFSRFSLPHGAKLWLANGDGTTVKGPWTDADNTRHGEFWTPIVEGARVRVELEVPTALKAHVVLELGTVHQAYREIWSGSSPLSKAGTCNVDAICPEGNPIRDPIRAQARMTFSGSLCSGQLVNTTRGDRRRLFTTANHCISTQSAANSLVLYWRYESPTCRTVGSPQNGQVIPLAGNSVEQTGGATLLATHAPSDATLLELNTPIPAAADPFWLGWDRGTAVPASTSVVHHPQGHEKRISFDLDPPQRIDNTTVNVPGSFHWRVVDWDLGTTEPGSSGSGLLNPQRRLIGFLSGGAAACGNDLDDYFGRLDVAWTGGGGASNRFSNHLDPDGTNALTVDGIGSCAAPSITFEAPATAVAGSVVTLRVTPAGSGPFRVEWDVEGDGAIDRTVTGVGGAVTQTAQYAQGGTINAQVRVTDATGCVGQAQRAVTILAPDVRATAGAPVEVCGDGDNVIEPGERWRIPVTLTNQAGAQAVSNGIASFGRVTTLANVGRDGFGNQVVDSTSPACGFQAIPVSAGVQPQPLTAAGPGFPARDDGRAANPLALGPNGLDFYGERITQLVMSTNGYLSTGLADTGGNFQNACGLVPPGQGSVGGRIDPLHDDLVVRNTAAGGLYREFFATCPRPLFAGAPAEGCTVFTWRDMERFDQGASTPAFTFQTIIYDRSWAIVHQYLSADPLEGGSATIGQRNPTASDGLEYACNVSGRAPANRAVCFYHPSTLPPQLRAANFSIATPASAIASLAPGASTTRQIEFEVDRNAACGAPLGVRYLGTVESARASLVGATTLFSGTVGSGGNCQVSTACPALPAATPLPRGFYTNFDRDGNAINVVEVPIAGRNPVLFGQWYTGTPDRRPSWLILQGDFTDRRVGSQAEVQVFRFTQDPATAVATGRVVGQGVVSYLSPSELVLTATIDGQPFGERQVLRFARPPLPRIGAWGGANEPGSAGWGLAIDEFPNQSGGSGTEFFFVHYVYNAAGQPVWTLGQVDAANPVTSAQFTIHTHCPTCARLPDWLSTAQAAGSLQLNFQGPNAATYSTTLTLPASVGGGTWTRSNIPLINLVPAP
jgi:hypothetical protein